MHNYKTIHFLGSLSISILFLLLFKLFSNEDFGGILSDNSNLFFGTIIGLFLFSSIMYYKDVDLTTNAIKLSKETLTLNFLMQSLFLLILSVIPVSNLLGIV